MIFNCPYGFGELREDLCLLVCRPKGPLTNDLVHDIITCRDCQIPAGSLSFNRFHDLREVTGVDVHFPNMTRLAEQEKKNRHGLRPVKACFLVPNPVLYGVMRMYQALAENAGVDAHISYNISDLAEVLGVDESKLTT